MSQAAMYNEAAATQYAKALYLKSGGAMQERGDG